MLVNSNHLNENMFSCQICGVEFTWENDLKLHGQVVHVKKHKVSSSICIAENQTQEHSKDKENSLKRSPKLSVPFKLTNSKITQYFQKDGLLAKDLKQNSALKCHQENEIRNSKKLLASDIDTTGSICLTCNKRFEKVEHLLFHVRHIHTGKVIFTASQITSQPAEREGHGQEQLKEIIDITNDDSDNEKHHLSKKRLDQDASKQSTILDIHDQKVVEKPNQPFNIPEDHLQKPIGEYKTADKVNVKSQISSVPKEKRKTKTCLICNKSFAKICHLKDHIMAIHDKIKPFKCPQCNFKAVRKSHVNHHIEAVHLKLKEFSCTFCDKTFGWNSNLKKHIKRTHSCNKEFTYSESLERQNQVEDHPRELNDIKDNSKQSYHGEVSEKINQTHNEDVSKDQDITNEVRENGNVQFSKNEFKTGSVHHEKGKAKMCLICIKSFLSTQDLKEHVMAMHDKIKPFKCSLCNFKSVRKRRLKYHIEYVHLNIRKFVCEICEKSFVNNRSLQYHIKAIHTGIREFKQVY